MNYLVFVVIFVLHCSMFIFYNVKGYNFKITYFYIMNYWEGILAYILVLDSAVSFVDSIILTTDGPNPLEMKLFLSRRA